MVLVLKVQEHLQIPGGKGVIQNSLKERQFDRVHEYCKCQSFIRHPAHEEPGAEDF